MSTVANTLPGQETLLACWHALAQRSPDARLVRTSAASAAVFPSWAPLNNAIALDPSDGLDALASGIAGLYADAGVDAWALWVPSVATSLDAPDEVGKVGALIRDTTTLV